ncbi:MAG: hypothetical protein ACK486_14955 [Cyanobacteriota bacterium]
MAIISYSLACIDIFMVRGFLAIGALTGVSSLLLPSPMVAPALAEAAPEPAGTAGTNTLINGTTEAQPHGKWSGTYQNTGVNLVSARQTRDGVLLRVKRLIKPGGDAAKEIARGIPIFSAAVNFATLGIYNRALKSDGAAVRATWLSLNCRQKTFNVSGDGYSWQDIFKDQYGQAEDIYYSFCVATQASAQPPYLSLPPADRAMLKSAQMDR